MSHTNVYLKPNVVIEPLVNRWYAWSHLISPATHALNTVDRHMSIMESYVMDPEIHAEAVLNPKMRGGPFMDVASSRVPDVEALLKQTSLDQEEMIELARAIKELDKMLLSDAKGFGLDAVYDKVPELLKGYVELYYDRNNMPGFRFFESLLYKSQYYKKELQSIALWVTNNDERPFCLSTPRLDDEHVIHLQIPFESSAIDELARMKRVPGDLRVIKKRLQVPSEQEALFESFFTETAPTPYAVYNGKKARMRYFGHACILIETNGKSILIDPLISYYGYHTDLVHFSDFDLPDVIDYVLLTHNHQDHILFETLLPLRHKIKNVIIPPTHSGKLEDPDLALMFRHIGFKNVITVGEMDEVCIDNVTITALPFTGEHSDLNILTKSCFHIRINAFTLLFLADSRVLERKLYERVYQQIGDVDVIFLGMECDGAPLTWLYGPLMTKKISREQDNSRRLAGSDCVRGMYLVDIFRPKEVYVYAMGQEPWVEFISSIKYTDASNPIVQSNMLVKQCTERGLIAERLYGEKEILYEVER